MNFKKSYLVIGVFVVFFLIIYIFISKNSTNNVLIENKPISKNVGSSAISMMYETEAKSGVYEVSTDSAWPTSGYTFNETLSKCENGSTLTWNSEKNVVIMEANLSDKCYAYFDLVPTGAETIIAQYTGVQGENGIYYHDSSLANGAQDNSYRYAGANPDNYVCFGSDAEECSTNNLYRIIGLFDDDGDKVYQIKLIKNTSLGNYYWDDNYGNTWETATVNTDVLGTYLYSLSEEYQNMIATHTWQVGGMALSDTNTAKQYYDEELNSGTTYAAKIGLMYVSDYGFGADPAYWATALYKYQTASTTDWLFLSSDEATISRDSDRTDAAFFVDSSGCVDAGDYMFIGTLFVHPSFYLESSVEISGGSGTMSDPYRLN